ncbi:MAG: hypothetical protein GWQ05_17015 [Verrucomicrobiaceae bacterium]|nr:hypothetical protein [Verrucomicrobiaceae bacterium]
MAPKPARFFCAYVRRTRFVAALEPEGDHVAVILHRIAVEIESLGIGIHQADVLSAVALVFERLVVAPPNSDKDVGISVTVDVGNGDAKLLNRGDGRKGAVEDALPSLCIESNGLLVARERDYITWPRQGFVQRFLQPKVITGHTGELLVVPSLDAPIVFTSSRRQILPGDAQLGHEPAPVIRLPACHG